MRAGRHRYIRKGKGLIFIAFPLLSIPYPLLCSTSMHNNVDENVSELFPQSLINCLGERKRKPESECLSYENTRKGDEKSQGFTRSKQKQRERIL